MKPVTGPDRLIAQMKNINGNTDGFQIVSTLKTMEKSMLVSFLPFKEFIIKAASNAGLTRHGEFYFNFPETGFTGIVCFPQSHLAVRTSPVENTLSFELFLSDRLINNINVAEHLYRSTVGFFSSDVLAEAYSSL